jgi:hypothetical protein
LYYLHLYLFLSHYIFICRMQVESAKLHAQTAMKRTASTAQLGAHHGAGGPAQQTLQELADRRAKAL